MLITIEPHGIFWSYFAYLYILTLCKTFYHLYRLASIGMYIFAEALQYFISAHGNNILYFLHKWRASMYGFYKYKKQYKNIIHIIHMHSTNNASIDVLSNRNILLETMNKFHCKSKTLTLLIICNKIAEFYLHQIISYAKFNEISITAMVHVSSASAQLLQLTFGHVNKGTQTANIKTRPNSALYLRRRCTSPMCEQSICKVQIYRNEIKLHPNYTV